MQNIAEETKFKISYKNLLLPEEAKPKTPHIFHGNTILCMLFSSPL